MATAKPAAGPIPCHPRSPEAPRLRSRKRSGARATSHLSRRLTLTTRRRILAGTRIADGSAAARTRWSCSSSMAIPPAVQATFRVPACARIGTNGC